MKKTIRDYDLNGKKVLIRCDLNVPIKDGKIIDDTRIKASLETIQYAISQNAKVIILSHLGRVKEEADLKKNNLKPVAERLGELLGQAVKFSDETRGENLEEQVKALEPKEVLVIQNTRYEDLDGKKESSNDKDLGAYWASLGDIFINDAFGTVHRAHASNVGIASHLPNGVGFLIEKELNALEKLQEPKRPFAVILGGSKVSDKIGVIENLVTKADYLIIGGGMAFTFLKAIGKNIGKSLLDEENIQFCKEKMEQYSNKIILPIDVNVAEELNETAPNHICRIENMKETEMGLDLGTESIEQMKKILESVETILWNGPLGVYEIEKYQTATKEILEYVTTTNKTVILGGGDIVAAATELGFKDKVTHASTGGGATLEYLEGKKLPGVESIENAK